MNWFYSRCLGPLLCTLSPSRKELLSFDRSEMRTIYSTRNLLRWLKFELLRVTEQAPRSSLLSDHFNRISFLSTPNFEEINSVACPKTCFSNQFMSTNIAMIHYSDAFALNVEGAAEPANRFFSTMSWILAHLAFWELVFALAIMFAKLITSNFTVT